MERDIQLIERVAKFLKEHGYSEDSLILEWGIGDSFRVDLAVIDPQTKRPIALFELKRQRKRETEQMAIKQIKRYAELLGDKTIPLYVVFESAESPFFEMFFLSDENGREMLKPVYQIPAFTNFKTRAVAKLLVENERKKRRTFDFFKIICWVLSIIISGLLFLDFLGCIDLTAERLGIIAIIIALIIVPYARKLYPADEPRILFLD